MRKLQEMIKMDKKLQKIYFTYYNLLIAQNLWQVHYQILSIIFLKKFIKLNSNNGTMTKYKTCGINYKYCECFLEYTKLKDNLLKYKYLCCNKNYLKKMKKG